MNQLKYNFMESAQREEIEQEIEESKLNDIEPVDMEVLKD